MSLTPGPVAEFLIGLVGRADKPLLLGGVVLVVLVVLAWSGRSPAAAGRPQSRCSRPSRWSAGSRCWPAGTGRWRDLVPVAAGLLVWVGTLSVLTEPLRRTEEALAAGASEAPASSRRTFLIGTGAVVGVSAVAALAGRPGRVGSSRGRAEPGPAADPPGERAGGAGGGRPRRRGRHALGDAGRRLLPDRHRARPAAIDADGVEAARSTAWSTASSTLSFDDLLDGELREAWVTLNCVSQPGRRRPDRQRLVDRVRLADLLARGRAAAGADAVLQTSEDGWTCGTPLSALTDDRDAMLAVAMNGRPLPIEHGFPVRMVVPGLYGYVSATKWVVDIEVTRFDRRRRRTGPSAAGPSRARSRRTRGSTCPGRRRPVPAGAVASAASPGRSTSASSGVEVAVDGGAWQDRRAGPSVPNDGHLGAVGRAVATPTPAGTRCGCARPTGPARCRPACGATCVPDGATGWHTIDVTAGSPAHPGGGGSPGGGGAAPGGSGCAASWMT